MLRYLRKLKRALAHLADPPRPDEHDRLMLGRLLANGVKGREQVASLAEVEFSVFSQWGDDGIVQWLVHRLGVSPQTFIEFGVEDYRESNTRFLLMNDNWSGFVMDGSPAHVARITGAEYFWRHDLQARAAFIDRENVNPLIASAKLGREIGLLHVDLDGNDYWVWQAIDGASPAIVILEYNSVFGIDRAISVPYDKNFVRKQAHYSHLYWGASLRALCTLSAKKGYAFVGSNSAGNNAYFVRRDALRGGVREIAPEEGYVESKFRESRDGAGRFDHLRGDARLDAIRGLPVVNVNTGEVEAL